MPSSQHPADLERRHPWPRISFGHDNSDWCKWRTRRRERMSSAAPRRARRISGTTGEFGLPGALRATPQGRRGFGDGGNHYGASASLSFPFWFAWPRTWLKLTGRIGLVKRNAEASTSRRVAPWHASLEPLAIARRLSSVFALTPQGSTTSRFLHVPLRQVASQVDHGKPSSEVGSRAHPMA